MSARHPGNIAALAAIAPPAIGVVLNVGTAHLGEFGSREAIARTKAELPQAVPSSGWWSSTSTTPRWRRWPTSPRRRVVRVSRSGRPTPPSDVWAGPVTLDELARPRFTLHAPNGRLHEVALGVYGDHQVTNALCAAAVALECGAGLEQVAAALAGAGPVSRHRMQVTTRADGVTVINDAYNANPDSMRAGLKALAWIAHGGAGARRNAAQLGGARRDGRARRGRDIRARPHRPAGGAIRCVTTHCRGNWEVDERHAPRSGHGGVVGRPRRP